MSRLPPAFGPFQPIRRLGAGGMAETFVAIRRGPGRFEQTVCIKRILPAHEEDAEYVAAFLDEARTSAGLRHANIVQVLDFGLADESHYLALELVDGIDLRALFEPVHARSGGGLPAELVTLIALDLSLALDHAHGPDPRRPRVAHRDISPSNVLISKAGEIKLTDFGIARAEYHTRRTRSGVLKGKVPYMAPEYIDQNVFDGRSDLFSLGVLLYELVAGHRPFDDGADIRTVRRIMTGQFERLSGASDAQEAALHTCVERLLQLDPEARFQSATALADALPEISTHRARRKLAALVEECTRAAADSSEARLLARKTTPIAEISARELGEARTALLAQKQAPVAAPLGSARTRTVARRRVRAPWLFFGLSLGVLAITALLWMSSRAALATRTLPVPQPPRWVSPAAPSTADARPPAAEPEAQEAPEASPAPESEAPAEVVGDALLRVVVVPYGDVWLDGEPVGSAPLSLHVTPGPHVVAVGDGKPEARRKLRLSARDALVTFRRDGEGRYH